MARTRDRLTAPECRHPKKTWSCDGDNLWLVSTNRQNWLFRFTSPVTGKKRKYWIGPFPLYSLKEARDKRDVLLKQVRDGRDPTAEKQQERAERKATRQAAPIAAPAPETFESLATAFLADNSGDWRGEHTLPAFNRRVGRMIAAVKDKPALAIDTNDVLAVVQPLWMADHRQEAQDTARVIRRVIGYGLARQHLPQTSNPAIWQGHLAHILTGSVPETQNATPFPWQEAPTFWPTLFHLDRHPALTAMPFLHRVGYPLAWMFAIGCRGAEARRLRRGWIDRDARIVRYPGTMVVDDKVTNVMKNGKPWWQPINDPAMMVLDFVGAWDRADDEHVFQPASVTESSGRGRSKAKSAAGDGELNNSYLGDVMTLISEFTEPHGIRSCLRMWLADHPELNCPEYLQEACIGHEFGTKVQRAYQQSRLVEAKRPYMAAWGRYLLDRVIERMNAPDEMAE